MSKNSQILKRVHYLLHRGENLAARRLLSVLLQDSPQDESVWMRYVDTFGSRAERKRAFEQWRRAMPNNVHARYGLERDARLKGRTQRPLSLRSTWLDNRFGWAILSAIFILSLSSIWVMAQSDDPPLQPVVAQLQMQYDKLLNNYLALQTNREQLQTSNEQLLNENNALQDAQFSLQGAYDRLTVQHDDLAADRDELWQEYETAVYDLNKSDVELQGTQANLNQAKAELQEAQAAQNTTQSDLDEIQRRIKILEHTVDSSPGIIIRGQQLEIVIIKEDGSIAKWQFDYDMDRNVDGASDQISIQINNGSTQKINDFGAFIDTAPFIPMMREVYFNRTSDKAFVREVWSIVTYLTSSSGSITNQPQFPLETLRRGGSSGDTAVLFASMILAAPIDWKVDLLYMDRNRIDNPRAANHVLVMIETEAELFTVDTTQSTQMQPYNRSNISGWRFEVKK